LSEEKENEDRIKLVAVTILTNKMKERKSLG